METLTLRRGTSTDQGTPGIITGRDGVRVCMTLELPWRDNARGVSCIPPGRYQVRYLERSASGKYRDVYHVQGVPGRDGILIHKGNFAGDTTLGWRSHVLGCILPCTAIGRLHVSETKQQRAALDSRGGLSALHAYTQRQNFILEVTPCRT